MVTGGAECKSILGVILGMDNAAIGKVAQIKSIAIVERYLDVNRHELEVRQSQAGKRSSEAMNM